MKKLKESGYSQGGASYTNPGSSFPKTGTTPAGIGDERTKHTTFPYSEKQKAEYLTFADEEEKKKRIKRFRKKKKKKKSTGKHRFRNKLGNALPISNPIDVDRGRRDRLTPGHSSISAPGMQHPNALRSGFERMEKIIFESLFESGIATSKSMSTVHNAYGRSNSNVENTGFGGMAPTVMKTKPGKKGGIGDYYGAVGRRSYNIEDTDEEGEENFTLWDIINSDDL